MEDLKMANEIIDGTQTNVPEEKASTQDKSPELEAAMKAKGELDDLLETHGYDSLEDLTEAVQKSKTVLSKIGTTDIEEILEKANTLDRYNEYWANEELKKKDVELEDSDRIAKLEKELNDFKSSKSKEESSRKAQEEAEKVIQNYANEITSFIGKQEEIPEEYRPFAHEFLGVNNPFNEIDIADKVAVRKMAKDNVKKIQDFEQAVIKRYRDGKIKIPEISSTEGAAPETGEVIIKNLKESRKGMLESLTKYFMTNKG